MKNTKKILLGAGGIVAALSLIGGGTFAAWSDFDTNGASVGAGILQLNVSSSGVSDSEALTFGNLAPGEKKYAELYVASSDADSVPDAVLSLDLLDLVDTEANGPGAGASVPTNCTTNSEADDEGNNNDIDDDAVDCAADGGEFSQEAQIQILKKAAVGGSCAGGGYGVIAGLGVGTLASRVAAAPVVIDPVTTPGEGTCVRVELGMPDGLNNGTNGGIDFGGSANSTDASQGDSSTFNVRFDLVQIT